MLTLVRGLLWRTRDDVTVIRTRMGLSTAGRAAPHPYPPMHDCVESRFYSRVVDMGACVGTALIRACACLYCRVELSL